LYLDTALASSPTSLPCVLAFTDPDHLLYGSDLPFASEMCQLRWRSVDVHHDRLVIEQAKTPAGRRPVRVRVSPSTAPSVARAYRRFPYSLDMKLYL
jgi:integrase